MTEFRCVEDNTPMELTQGPDYTYLRCPSCTCEHWFYLNGRHMQGGITLYPSNPDPVREYREFLPAKHREAQWSIDTRERLGVWSPRRVKEARDECAASYATARYQAWQKMPYWWRLRYFWEAQ